MIENQKIERGPNLFDFLMVWNDSLNSYRSMLRFSSPKRLTVIRQKPDYCNIRDGFVAWCGNSPYWQQGVAVITIPSLRCCVERGRSSSSAILAEQRFPAHISSSSLLPGPDCLRLASSPHHVPSVPAFCPKSRLWQLAART